MIKKVQVILDKGKTKAKLLVFYDLTDAFFILGGALLGYSIGGLISPLFELILSISCGGIIAFLKFEFPNTYSIYDYLKLGYKYYLVNSQAYIYYPLYEKHTEIISKEKEYETKIEHRRKKKKRKGKTFQ